MTKSSQKTAGGVGRGGWSAEAAFQQVNGERLIYTELRTRSLLRLIHGYLASMSQNIGRSGPPLTDKEGCLYLVNIH